MKRPMKQTLERKSMIEVARLEIDAWTKKGHFTKGVILAILWSFIHRYTTGQSIEDMFGGEKPEPEYQI